MRLRTMSNGTKFAPHRGKPPACPDGYVRSKGDPFVFYPILEPCEYRGEKRTPQKCCRNDRVVTWCKRDDKEINAKICILCMECNNENQPDNNIVPT